jgi:hypothetical protein
VPGIELRTHHTPLLVLRGVGVGSGPPLPKKKLEAEKVISHAESIFLAEVVADQ